MRFKRSVACHVARPATSAKWQKLQYSDNADDLPVEQRRRTIGSLNLQPIYSKCRTQSLERRVSCASLTFSWALHDLKAVRRRPLGFPVGTTTTRELTMPFSLPFVCPQSSTSTSLSASLEPTVSVATLPPVEEESPRLQPAATPSLVPRRTTPPLTLPAREYAQVSFAHAQ